MVKEPRAAVGGDGRVALESGLCKTMRKLSPREQSPPLVELLRFGVGGAPKVPGHAQSELKKEIRGGEPALFRIREKMFVSRGGGGTQEQRNPKLETVTKKNLMKKENTYRKREEASLSTDT